MNLDKEIEETLGKLMGGGDPKEALKAFAQKIKSENATHECPNCNEKDVVCFRCKVTEVAGEKALESAPMVAMAIGGHLQEWWKERKAKKAQEATQQQVQQAAQAQAAQARARAEAHARYPHMRRPPPPPTGKQRF